LLTLIRLHKNWTEEKMNADQSKNELESKIQPKSQRILSVDALRGFDMFWIVGGEGVVIAIIKLFGVPAQKALLPQLDHAPWAGFTFYDLIFPLFVFLVGMSTVFSLGKLISTSGKKAAYQRLIRRFMLLFLMGIFYYGGLANKWPEIRLLGVLQRISLCYLSTGILFIHFRLRGLIITFVILLVSYWAFLTFIPVPGQSEISFAEGQNLTNYLDSQYLIGRKWDGKWDPEGLLSTLPAIATCLLGVFVALLLKNQSLAEKKKVYYLIGGGILSLILGYLWGLQFPIIKKIWTSSYVLVAGGYSCLSMGIFYLVIDIWKIQKWTLPFIWIGTNAITTYMARNILDFDGLAARFVGGDLQNALGQQWGLLLLAAVSLALTLLLIRFLYQRKIFLRV
jgi:predicted acyltransferase